MIKIGIGGNYDADSWPHFIPLLDVLAREGLTPEMLYMVKFDPVLRAANQQGITAKYHGGCSVCHEPWILNAESVLREEILKRGYYTPRIQPIMCSVDNKSTYVVNFDGEVYKCPAFSGQAAFSLGRLDDELRDEEKIYRSDLWKNAECLDCAYLPLCYGGCRYMSFLRNNGEIGKDCRRIYLDEALERIVMQDIAYQKRT